MPDAVGPPKRIAGGLVRGRATTYGPAMTWVATLIAARDEADLPLLARALSREFGASERWLRDRRAVDLDIDGDRVADMRSAAPAAIGDRPVDVAVQPAHGRRKRLLVADMDSTVIAVECIDVLASRAGLGSEVAAITRRTILGEIDFGDSLRERTRLLAGAPEALLERAWREDVATTPGAAVAVATMKAHGATTALVSGGFAWFAGRVAATLGFDRHYANGLDIRDGVLTGDLAGPVLDRNAKRRVLRELTRESGLSPAETLAVGDGANDLRLLEAAGLGVGYRPVPALRDGADAVVAHNDLTALLYLQGYDRPR